MASPAPHGRPRLNRDRVLQGALAVADSGGIASLTIRSLATHLDVKPMTVYHHVANKDAILDGIVDLVFAEIELPVVGGDWRAEMSRRAASARSVLRRHPWAIGLMGSSRNPGPATLTHHDAVVGTLRSAGFSVVMTAHAYALIDAYVYGFALSEASLPINGPEPVPEIAEQMMSQYQPEAYPHLHEFSTEHIMQPDYDFGTEFEYGLELVLDGLERSVGR